jgi:methyl-accepting chemotaxis protein
VQIIQAVVKGLTDALPELIPAVVAAIVTITTELTKFENLELIISAALDIVIALAEGLVKAVPELLKGVVSLNTAFLDEIGKLGTEVGTKAGKWGKDLIDNFVQGVKNKFGDLKKTVSEAAGIVADFLGFSCPDKGPLATFDKAGGDMVELFTEGIEDNLGKVQTSVNDMASIVAGVAQPAPDYTGNFNTLTAAVNGVAAKGQQIVIPVSIGGERLETLVVNAQNRANFRSGGR